MNPQLLSSDAANSGAYSDQYPHSYGHQTHGDYSDGTWRFTLEWPTVRTAFSYMCCTKNTYLLNFVLSLSNSLMLLAWHWWRCGDVCTNFVYVWRKEGKASCENWVVVLFLRVQNNLWHLLHIICYSTVVNLVHVHVYYTHKCALMTDTGCSLWIEVNIFFSRSHLGTRLLNIWHTLTLLALFSCHNIIHVHVPCVF